MGIPTYDEFIPPLLRVLAENGDGLRSVEVYDKVAEVAGLSEKDQATLLPSRSQPVFQNRIGWAHDRLKRAGLSSSPRRGFWKLTEEGLAFVASHRDGIDAETLEKLAIVPRASKVAGAVTIEPATNSKPQSPEERIDASIEELHDSLSDDLLAMIANATPSFFERLVLDLLLAMDYGATRANLQQVGGSGDGGIDGVITLDRLGLEKVYVQAKRWKGNVGRPELQAFFGALAGRRARMGVFITTSSYTREAREYAKSVSDSIVLVDGGQLTSLMIEHGVGVSHRTLRLARLDGDYFEDA